MNKLLLIFFSLAILFFESCNEHNSTSSDKTKYYEEYNPVSLKGNLPIEKSKAIYPYVAIEDSSSIINIKHYINKDTVYQSIYRKKGDFLNREYSYNVGMSSMLYDEYLLKDSMIVLLYNTSISKKLSSISIFSNNILKTYTLRKELDTIISVDKALEYVSTMPFYSVMTIAFKKQADSIFLNMKFQNFDLPEVSYKNNFAFYANNKSLDWWLIFRWQTFLNSIVYFEDIKKIK